VLARIPVTGERTKAVVIAATDFQDVLPRTDHVTLRIKLPRKLTGPLKADARIGTATVLVNERPAATVPLVLGRAVPAQPVLKKVAHLIGRPTTLGGLAVLIGVVVTALELRRRRPRKASNERRVKLEAR
jgi:hypothetical protein